MNLLDPTLVLHPHCMCMYYFVVFRMSDQQYWASYHLSHAAVDMETSVGPVFSPFTDLTLIRYYYKIADIDVWVRFLIIIIFLIDHETTNAFWL